MRKQTFTETLQAMESGGQFDRVVKIDDHTAVGENNFAYTIVEASSETAFSIQYVKKSHLEIIEKLLKSYKVI